MSRFEDHLAKSTPSRLWTNWPPNVKVWRPSGKVTPSRLWSNLQPNFKVWRPSGKVTPSRLWSNWQPNFKVWRLLGKVTPSRLWSNWSPNFKVWRLFGKVTPSRLWSNWSPNFKVWRLFGKVTPSRLWSNWPPNVKVWKPSGKVTPSRLWSNWQPNVKVWRPSGKVTPSRLWLNAWPNFRVLRPLGNVTVNPSSLRWDPSTWGWREKLSRFCKYWPRGAPSSRVTPSIANSPSFTEISWTQHQAAYKSIGTKVQFTTASFPRMPCCCRVWSDTRAESLWNRMTFPRFFRASRSRTAFRTSGGRTAWILHQPGTERLSWIGEEGAAAPVDMRPSQNLSLLYEKVLGPKNWLCRTNNCLGSSESDP